jgi:hypothetical protein
MKVEIWGILFIGGWDEKLWLLGEVLLEEWFFFGVGSEFWLVVPSVGEEFGVDGAEKWIHVRYIIIYNNFWVFFYYFWNFGIIGVIDLRDFIGWEGLE